MCENTGNSVIVTINPTFMDIDQETMGYFWIYKMKIVNNFNKAIQVVTKYLQVVDEDANKYAFSAKGVLGDCLVLQPSESIEYSSGIPLFSSSGMGYGQYLMHTEMGEELIVPIPPFSLDSPYSRAILN